MLKPTLRGGAERLLSPHLLSIMANAAHVTKALPHYGLVGTPGVRAMQTINSVIPRYTIPATDDRRDYNPRDSAAQMGNDLARIKIA